MGITRTGVGLRHSTCIIICFIHFGVLRRTQVHVTYPTTARWCSGKTPDHAQVVADLLMHSRTGSRSWTHRDRTDEGPQSHCAGPACLPRELRRQGVRFQGWEIPCTGIAKWELQGRRCCSICLTRVVNVLPHSATCLYGKEIPSTLDLVSFIHLFDWCFRHKLTLTSQRFAHTV